MGRNLVIAPDKFKGCLSSPKICRLLESGLDKQLPDHWQIISCPQADGGEGTVEAVVEAQDGKKIKSTVHGPLGREVEAEWGWVETGEAKTAIVEMAAASGLALLEEEEQNPLQTTTYGTGEIIREAASRGADKILLGIGGSATVDGGTGVAAALGFRLLDENGEPVDPCGGNLDRIKKIDASNVDRAVKNLEIKVACDVTNPLLGSEGAARVYGPQKGATEQMVPELENNMENWAAVLENFAGKKLREEPGTGAAGGLGFGLMGLLDASLTSGAKLVGEVTGLNSLLENADVLITGEGKMDEQTAYGKTPAVVAEAGDENDVFLVLGVTGARVGNVETLYNYFDYIFAIPNRPMSLQESMELADDLLLEWGAEVGRLINKVFQSGS